MDFLIDFWEDLCPFLGPFLGHFVLILVTKTYKKSHRISMSLPGAIWGDPGTPQARKVWFYLSKT